MKRNCWNKCQVCGRFISYEELDNGDAEHSVYINSKGEEESDTYHIRCDKTFNQSGL